MTPEREFFSVSDKELQRYLNTERRTRKAHSAALATVWGALIVNYKVSFEVVQEILANLKKSQSLDAKSLDAELQKRGYTRNG